MEPGSENIADDELLYRRVPVKPPWYDPEIDSRVSPVAFRPHKDLDAEGLSLQRAIYITPEAMARNDRNKRYYVAVLSAGELRTIGLEIVPDPQPGKPGHSLIKNMNANNRKSDQAREWQVLMAEKLCRKILGPYGPD